MTRDWQTIRLDPVREGVVRLVLDRPEKHNALESTMLAEITAAAEALAADTAVRVVILSGEGRSFCAGGDLAWLREQAGQDRAAKMEGAQALAKMFDTLDQLPKLLIAEVQGPAYGGGVGLVAVCDIALASDASIFALTEARLGLIPATIAPFVVRRIGAPHARRVMLNARRFDAGEALRMGLVSAVLPAGELGAAVLQEVELALECAPGAVAATKAMVQRLAAGESIGALGTASSLADRWETPEAQAGLAAFFGRTRPPWSAG
jgi:methylglutaconyl-CoA hydratase